MAKAKATTKRQYKNKGDQQAEALGQIVIGIGKSIGAGIRSLKDKTRLINFLAIVLVSVLVFLKRQTIIAHVIPNVTGFHVLKLFLAASILIPVVALYFFGTLGEEKDIDFEEKFASIGFCGKGQKYPEFIKKEVDGKKIIYYFLTPGITLLEWRQRREQLETVLDCNIVKIETAPNTKQIIKVHTVPEKAAESGASIVNGISTNIRWSDDFIRDKDFEVTVGQAIIDEAAFDFNKVPHALIAGVTGSGKSVLLRCILWQFVVKGAHIYMIDFKGGVEFGKEFEAFGEVVTDRQVALEILKELTRENALRLALFREVGVKNLVEYNEAFPDEPLCRIGLFCDEIAEMLDKTGLSSEDKAIFYAIEKELNTLARLSRATGINMVLATQRPDAKVLAGQIKNNLPIRISGRMIDPQTSEMVLGSPKAATLSDVRGRFLYNIGADTYEFQAYNFQDSDLKRGNYRWGSMLIEKSSGEDNGLLNKINDSDAEVFTGEMVCEADDTDYEWVDLP